LILLDSNVLIAALVVTHPHHEDSFAVLERATVATMMVAAHNLAETYSVVTRATLPYKVSGATAAQAIDRMAGRLTIAILSAAQTLDAIRRFGAIGTGPRLYDYLIGATAEAHGADTIVTWNSRDFDGLFPALRIVTPAALPLP